MTNFVKAFSEIWQATLNDFIEPNLSVFVKISFSFVLTEWNLCHAQNSHLIRHYAKFDYAECLHAIYLAQSHSSAFWFNFTISLKQNYVYQL